MNFILVFAVLPAILAKPLNYTFQLWDQECGYSQYEDAGIDGGVASAVPRGRMIVGGWPARPNEFPYQVSLINTGGRHFCGGVLITHNAVLTAAHCTVGETVNTMKVTIGEHLRSEQNINKRDLTISKIINHPNYNNWLLLNDISVLILSEDVEWSDLYRPACAPSNSVTHYAGSMATVSGWGTQRSGGRGTDELRYTNVPVMELSECERCMPDLADGMLCAGACGTNTRDSCQGDSGGPLVVKNQEGLFELVGIVSWGFGCAASTPGVYADVQFYMDWVESNLI